MAAKFMAEALASAAVQEVVSKGAKSLLGKRKEKASQGEYLERLETALYHVALAFERAAKLQVTDVCLLRRWAKLKREYVDGTNLLGKLHKKRRDQPQQETGQALVTRSSSSSSPHHGRRRHWIPRPAALLSVVISSFIGRLSKDHESLCLSCETVKRFERLAASARDFLESVQSGCSLRRLMVFSGPLVSHLFEGKILMFQRAEGSRQQRCFYICPMRLQERGVEAQLGYIYIDHESREKSFGLGLMLRLSESTSIVQVAIKCLKSLESQFKLVLAPAIGELTLLAGSPDITAHPYAPTKAVIQEENYTQLSQSYRSDPVCCSASSLHEPCANDMASSSFSKMFPEEVIMFGLQCSISSTLPDHPKLLPPGSSSSDEAGTNVVMKDPRPLLRLYTVFVPHFMPPHAFVNSLLEDLQKEEGIAFEDILKQYRNCSIRHAAKTAINGLFLMQELNNILGKQISTLPGGGSHLLPKLPTCCNVRWFSKHGAAFFKGEII